MPRSRLIFSHGRCHSVPRTSNEVAIPNLSATATSIKSSEADNWGEEDGMAQQQWKLTAGSVFFQLVRIFAVEHTTVCQGLDGWVDRGLGIFDWRKACDQSRARLNDVSRKK